MKTPKRASEAPHPMTDSGDNDTRQPLRLFKVRYIGPTGIIEHDVSAHFIQCMGESAMNFYEVLVDAEGRTGNMLRFGCRNWIDVVEMDTIPTRLVH